MENDRMKVDDLPNMVIFQGYVRFPEGSWLLSVLQKSELEVEYSKV